MKQSPITSVKSFDAVVHLVNFEKFHWALGCLSGPFPYIAENYIDGSTGQVLQFRIFGMSAYSRQQTIQNVSHQRIMKEYCQALNWNSRVSKLIQVVFQHRPDERGCSCRPVGVPCLTDFRTV